jgi:hypothetical protein
MKEFSDPVRHQLLVFLRSHGLTEPKGLKSLTTLEKDGIVSEIDMMMTPRNATTYNRFNSMVSANHTLHTDFGDSEGILTGDSKNRRFGIIPIKKEESMKLDPIEELEQTEEFKDVQNLDPAFIRSCQEAYKSLSDIGAYRKSIEYYHKQHHEGNQHS